MLKALKTVVILLIVGGGLFGGYHLYTGYQLDRGVASVEESEAAATVIKRPSRTTETASETQIGGAFEMIDHNGNVVTDQNYADKYKLVFFGFTYCPAICPTELQKVNVILQELGPEAEKITPLLVTVDPERDTVEQMAQYVAQFHPRLVGLTGSQGQVDEIKQTFRVYASKVENEMMEEYMMDHSAFLYLTDLENKMIAIYPSKDTAVDIAKDIKSRDLAF